jgi:guanylate kinase
MRHATEHFPELGVLNSYTTRPRRPDHVENDHYRFVSVDEFKSMIDRGEFLEWAEFSGNYYGTRKQDVEECVANGKVIIKEMEVQGVRQLKGLLPKDDLITVFIDAGPWDGLVERALKRDHLSEEEIARRKARFDDEITFMPEADVIVHNGAGQREEADQAFEEVVAKAIAGS